MMSYFIFCLGTKESKTFFIALQNLDYNLEEKNFIVSKWTWNIWIIKVSFDYTIFWSVLFVKIDRVKKKMH